MTRTWTAWTNQPTATADSRWSSQTRICDRTASHTHSYTGSESGVLGDNFQGIVCKPIKSSGAGLDHFRIKSCISVVWDDAIKSSLLGLSLHPVYCITFNLFSAEILENWTRVCLLLIILALAFLRKNKRGMWKKNGRTEGRQDNPFP